MAGGPIFPASAYTGDTTGQLTSGVYGGGGGNAAPHDLAFEVAASLANDVTLELRFHVPPALPTGTCKLRLLAMANATSGAAKLTVSDGRCPGGSSPSAATLTSETQNTVTWTAVDVYLETKITFTGLTGLAANDVIVVALKWQTSGWTLAQNSFWFATVIWE